MVRWIAYSVTTNNLTFQLATPISLYIRLANMLSSQSTSYRL